MLSSHLQVGIQADPRRANRRLTSLKSSFIMKRILFVPLLMIITGCASAPRGANWALADFGKYDKNYATLQTNRIEIGQSKAALLDVLPKEFRTVEAGQGYEVLAFQKWKAVAGPDYVEQTLYVRIADDRVTHWKLTNDIDVTVLPTW
jgi:hypothetical protein